jgi:hypothetical protein
MAKKNKGSGEKEPMAPKTEKSGGQDYCYMDEEKDEKEEGED